MTPWKLAATVVALTALLAPAGGFFHLKRSAALQVEAIQQAHASMLSGLELNIRKIKALSPIPEASQPDISSRIKKAITGAYDSEGGRAVFQLVLEHNPRTDLALLEDYRSLTAQAQREFTEAATLLEDHRAAYIGTLSSPWRHTIFDLLGYTEQSIAAWPPATTPAGREHMMGLN